VLAMDPAKTIFLGDRAEALPAIYSIGDATPVYSAGIQRPVYKVTRTDTAELVACTKISKASLDRQDGMQALQQVGHKRSPQSYIGLTCVVGGGLTRCSGAGP
jgi:hypothetical protein